MSRGGRLLLSNFDLDLLPGQTTGLTGPSGCGKSSLLRVIAALDPPEAGCVEFNDALLDPQAYPAYRRKVVLLAQEPRFHDTTVEANLRRVFTYQSAYAPYNEDRAREGLEALGLEPGVYTQPAQELSVGQRQRVSLLRALLVEPAVLLLDEPTSALDPASTDQAFAMIQSHCARRNMAALIVSHEVAATERCDHVYDLGPNRAGVPLS